MKKVILIMLTAIIIALFQQVAKAESYTITSAPVKWSGYSSDDGQGNSISINKSTNVPVIMREHPHAVWIYKQNGSIPNGAIIMEYLNQVPVYYCKVEVRGRVYYGAMLYGDSGCNIPSISDTPISNHWILSN